MVFNHARCYFTKTVHSAICTFVGSSTSFGECSKKSPKTKINIAFRLLDVDCDVFGSFCDCQKQNC